jgi:TonB family protein
VKEYYANGKLKIVGKSSKIEKNLFEGQYVAFYPSGKRSMLANYRSGHLYGEAFEYYPNGKLYCEKKYIEELPTLGANSVGNLHNYRYLIKTCNDSTGKTLVAEGNGHYIAYNDKFKWILEQGDIKNGERDGLWTGNIDGRDSIKFKETYDNSQLIEGSSVDNTGKTYVYTKREITPEYEGGEKAFAKFLQRNVRYPKKAKENNIQGSVYISFVIEKNGKLTDIKAVRDPGGGLGDEGVRVLALSPNWTPGLQYGRPVKVQYTVPINFSLGER